MAREERIEDILTAAREAFCNKGYEQTAVAEIAARMGVVEGTIYKYFASKRELLLAVLDHWYAGLFGDHRRELAAERSARAQLHLLISRHLTAIHDDPQLCRLMFREVRSGSDYAGSPLQLRNRDYTGLLVQVLRRGIVRGEFRKDVDATLLRDLVFGAIEHHSWRYLNGRGTLAVSRIAGQLVGVVCEGIASGRSELARDCFQGGTTTIASKLAPTKLSTKRKRA